MRVEELIKRKGDFVPVIGADKSLTEAIGQLKIDDTGALVVTDDGDTILGLISEENIVRGIERFGRDVVDRPVTDFMSTKVVTCDIGDSMDEAMALMDHHQIRHVPVVCDGKLCGIVAIHDVLRHRMSELKLEADALKEYVAGRG